MVGSWKVGVVVAMVVAGVGCATGGAAPQAEPTRPQAQMRADEALDAAAPWLAGDTGVVAVWTGEQGWGQVALPFTDEGLEEGAPGTREALVADLSAQMERRLGFDPRQIDTVVVGFSTGDMRIVAMSEAEMVPTLHRAEAMEGEVYVSTLEELSGGMLSYGMVPFMQMPEIYVRPVEVAGRSGLVIWTEREAYGPEELVGFEGSEAHTQLKAILSERDEQGPGFAVGARLATLSPISGTHPDAALLSLGQELKVVFHGEDARLEQMQMLIDRGIAPMREQTETMYLEREQGSMLDATMAIYGYHLSERLFSQATPELSEGRLVYSVGMGEGQLRSLLTFGAMIGAMQAQKMYRRYVRGVEEMYVPAPEEESSATMESLPPKVMPAEK